MMTCECDKIIFYNSNIARSLTTLNPGESDDLILLSGTHNHHVVSKNKFSFEKRLVNHWQGENCKENISEGKFTKENLI